MKKHVIPLLMTGLLALLTACGGSDDSSPPPRVEVPLPAPTAPAPTPAPTPVDAFFAMVASVVASMSDDTEPVALDNSAPTMPENTEPQAVTQ